MLLVNVVFQLPVTVVEVFVVVFLILVGSIYVVFVVEFVLELEPLFPGIIYVGAATATGIMNNVY